MGQVWKNQIKKEKQQQKTSPLKSPIIHKEQREKVLKAIPKIQYHMGGYRGLYAAKLDGDRRTVGKGDRQEHKCNQDKKEQTES